MTILARLKHWQQQGAISPEQYAHLAGLCRREPFSVFLELKFSCMPAYWLSLPDLDGQSPHGLGNLVTSSSSQDFPRSLPHAFGTAFPTRTPGLPRKRRLPQVLSGPKRQHKAVVKAISQEEKEGGGCQKVEVPFDDCAAEWIHGLRQPTTRFPPGNWRGCNSHRHNRPR